MRFIIPIKPENYPGQTVVASEMVVVTLDEVERIEAERDEAQAEVTKLRALIGAD